MRASVSRKMWGNTLMGLRKVQKHHLKGAPAEAQKRQLVVFWKGARRRQIRAHPDPPLDLGAGVLVLYS